MALKFYKFQSAETVSKYLVRRIAGFLEDGKTVLWLVAGGSAVNVAVRTARQLRPGRDLKNLTVTLTDEHYGPVGHNDSNWRQLINKGFKLPGARMLPVLGGGTLAESAAAYGACLERELAAADFSLALAGMGGDGHIFGIKPGSPAVDSRQPVIGYDWEDFRRLTPTAVLLDRLDEVDLFVSGTQKHIQLDALDKTLPPSRQPAQLLKNLKNVKIFNDYKGEVI